MKHRALTATALVAGLFCQFANAQDQVSIYGVVDAYAGAVRTATEGKPGVTTGVVNSGGMTTSFIGFKGSEDLGSGLKAIFSIECNGLEVPELRGRGRAVGIAFIVFIRRA